MRAGPDFIVFLAIVVAGLYVITLLRDTKNAAVEGGATMGR